MKSTARQVHRERVPGTWIMVVMMTIANASSTDYSYVPSTILGRMKEELNQEKEGREEDDWLQAGGGQSRQGHASFRFACLV